MMELTYRAWVTAIARNELTASFWLRFQFPASWSMDVIRNEAKKKAAKTARSEYLDGREIIDLRLERELIS